MRDPRNSALLLILLAFLVLWAVYAAGGPRAVPGYRGAMPFHWSAGA